MRRFLLDGEWLDAEEYAFRSADPQQLNRRADFPAPRLARDGMSHTQSMADGRWYDSKAAIRRTYKANGNPQGVEYSEVGSDQSWRKRARPQPKSDPAAVREAILRADSRANLTS